jgi:hypothetical protein
MSNTAVKLLNVALSEKAKIVCFQELLTSTGSRRTGT